MEGQGPLQLGVAAPDLAGLGEIAGPFLTVYLPTEPDIENAAQRSETAWRSARRDLEDQGVPASALAPIDELIPDAHQRGRCLAVVASAGGVLHVEHGPEAPPTARTTWDALPALAPTLEWRQSRPPHVLVLADRGGADLIGFRGEETEARRTTGNQDHTISKVAPGGWSQRRYQERAENSWEDNARATAEELSRLVKQIQARLIVAAGDVRALQMLEADLPKELGQLFTMIEGSRAEGADKEQIEAEARRQVEVLVAQETSQILEKLREEAGQADLGVRGKDSTIEALARAQVDTLLLHDDLEDDRVAWFGSDPAAVAATESRLQELGVEPRTQGRLVDVLIRSALGTGATVRIIPAESGVPDGVGALLRWTQAGPQQTSS